MQTPFQVDKNRHVVVISADAMVFEDVAQFSRMYPLCTFWDKTARLGQTEAMLTLLEEAAETLLQYDNAEIQFFMADREVITNLDNYADHIHVAGRVTYRMARAMPTGEYRLTSENRTEVLDGLRDFVIHYDYESIWAE